MVLFVKTSKAFIVMVSDVSCLQPVKRQSLTAPAPNTISWEEYITAEHGKYAPLYLYSCIFLYIITELFRSLTSNILTLSRNSCIMKSQHFYLRLPASRPPHLGRELVCKESKKNFKATVAMSQDFPLGIES